ncbi:UNVERIFIED_CONTAM: hypothetical protein Sradi_6432000 [Sesamum radiatum]|uniref:Retrotransposon Copia-like N-terminal domain-containing protein n=1 Tax=Sesamum radiatum TaxID=300843 RepID=A0AAW2K5U7_SESRA
MNGGSTHSGIDVEKLVGNNYNYWKLCMEAFLQGQDLWDLIEGDETPILADTSQNVELQRKWKIKCGKTLFSLQTSISKEYIDHVRDLNQNKYGKLFRHCSLRRIQLGYNFLENELAMATQEYSNQVKCKNTAVAGSGSSSTSGTNAAHESEDLKIHTSDFPGMILVSTPLVRNNYLLWSRSVKVALTAKMKLSFIDGTYLKPIGNTEECKQWIRTDSMVFSWIMNSISKDIAKAFSYAKSARNLWLQLEARFGQANGPMIYNLQQEIASISQGDMDVVSYFTKITMLWDELECVDPTLECSCSVSAKVASTQLMQFLMGLNDSLDAIRSQILVMDPLPSVDKAYSLVLKVENQRQ